MIELYIWQQCPFCQKVLRAADAIGLQEGRDYTVINGAPGSPGRNMVAKTGGKGMVPFLIDGDISMYESDDIISYLQNKAGQ